MNFSTLHQIRHRNPFQPHAIVEREHFYVKQAEKIEEYRNGRKPQEIPVGNEQMIYHGDERRQHDSNHGQFFYKFLLNGQQNIVSCGFSSGKPPKTYMFIAYLPSSPEFHRLKSDSPGLHETPYNLQDCVSCPAIRISTFPANDVEIIRACRPWPEILPPLPGKVAWLTFLQ